MYDAECTRPALQSLSLDGGESCPLCKYEASVGGRGDRAGSDWGDQAGRGRGAECKNAMDVYK